MTSDLKNILETLIFISLEPLSFEKIRSLLPDFTAEDIQKTLEELVLDYAQKSKGIQIVQLAGGYIFSTKIEYDPWIRQLLRVERKNRLSIAAMETLSTVAYYQPLTLAEISAFRGVDSSHSLKTLLQKRLVKIIGRKKTPGKPLIYRTSNRFLSYFGLESLKDLPSQDEISKILELEEKQDTE
ncbi:MAG: SMC-Scp complex subunit ScpB [Candidatus Aminicenantes bacterium]|nr:SMC-Scp complex subunit ScpB [Candidatus Aminicenantes bacterium]